MVEFHIPYLKEYAKNNRLICKTCNIDIEKDHLRVAVPSSVFGVDVPPNWYHFVCYFTEQSLKGASSAVHFAPKGEEDKKKIKKKSGSTDETVIPASGGKKCKQKNVDHSRSGNATCTTARK